MSKSELLHVLDHACRDLIFISEIDAALVPFEGPLAGSITAEIVLNIAKVDDGSVPIEEVNADEFFLRLTTSREWHGDVQKERAKKFQELILLLKENLRHLKVFRVGKVRSDIYITGLAADGRVFGIKTTVVET